MTHYTVSMAGIAVGVTFTHPYLATSLQDYRTDDAPVLEFVMTDEDIAQERGFTQSDGQFSDGYLESLAFYRKLCSAVASRGVFLFHSCVMEANGKAYLFAAPSGTGKSTHARLWKEVYGEQVRVLNGDKPLLRIVNDVPTVYGTPYRGKEGWGYNGNAPIGGICFLHRATENSIRRIDSSEALTSAFSQLYRPNCTESTGINDTATVINALIAVLNAVPLWSLECNISTQAAKLSYEAMTKPW